jgi:hypothetical protein
MNTRNDNPNVVVNECNSLTEFRITRDGRLRVAQKKNGENWVDLKRYRTDKGEIVRATFVSDLKARRFIKKLEINAEENGKKEKS